MSDHPDPLPAERLCNRYNNPNPILAEGALGNQSAGRMYFQGPDQRDLVETVQKMLKELGYDLGTSGPAGDGVDGSFGPATEEAVRQFQEIHLDWDGEPLRTDGLVGPRTADALDRQMVGHWYSKYQTSPELLGGELCYIVTAGHLAQGLAIQPGTDRHARLFLAQMSVQKKAHKTVKVIEFDDALFRTESAVLLPDGQIPQDQPAESNGVWLVAACLRYSQEHPEERLLIAGHTDTTGNKEYNVILSQQRAISVHAVLIGDKDSFQRTAHERHLPADERQILRWAADRFGWPCNPDSYGGELSRATYEFHKSYNQDPKVFTTHVEPTWVFTLQSWGAVFDCYQYQLADDLGIDTGDLASFRGQNLRFIDEREWVGCGEYHPIEEKNRDEYRSQTNRRVEALYSPSDDQPHLLCEGGRCESCEIYDQDRYTWVVLPKMPSTLPWSASWQDPDNPAIIDSKREMFLFAHGLPDGETIRFQVEIKMDDGISPIGGVLVAQSLSEIAMEVNETWFDKSLLIKRTDLEEGQQFPSVQFRFEAEGAGRRVLSPWLDYRDQLILRFLHRSQSHRPLRNKDYYCYSPWGRLRGRTDDEGRVNLTSLPPGGALVLLKNYRLYTEPADEGLDVTIRRQYRAMVSGDVHPPHPKLIWLIAFAEGEEPQSHPQLDIQYSPGEESDAISCSQLNFDVHRWRGENLQSTFHKTIKVQVRWEKGSGEQRIAIKQYPAGSPLNTPHSVNIFVDEHFLVVGHRGSPLKKVENTIPSYKEALENDGANALEIDLCLTADGEVVVWHDWDPDDNVAWLRQQGLEPGTAFMPIVPAQDGSRSAFRRRTNQLTLSEIRAEFGYAPHSSIFRERRRLNDVIIPTFEEFVVWAKEQRSLLYVFLDMKFPPDEMQAVPIMLNRINAILIKYQPDFQVVTLSPHRAIHERMREVSPNLVHSFDKEVQAVVSVNPEQDSSVQMAIDIGNQAASIGRPVISIRPSGFLRQIVAYDTNLRAIHNADPKNLPVEKYIVWTIDDEGDMRDLISLGTDGMLSNHPAALRRIAIDVGRPVDS